MAIVSELVDSYGRRVTTLRVSLTESCNFRCVYCMPPEGLPHGDPADYLSLDEIVRVVRIARSLGVTRIRLTGGEPLLRKDILDIVKALREVDSTLELSMTTNGSRLADLAAPLRAAGLDRINVSLDSLEPERFEHITRSRRFDAVRAGIRAAFALGFPIKLNVVVLKGMSDEEILAFAAMAERHPIDVRFLEFMPLCGSAWEATRVLPIAQVRECVAERYTLVALPRGDRPAETFEIRGGKGRVGFIGSLSEPFCSACSRMRLTANGAIRPCLFSSYEVPLLQLLRNGTGDTELAGAIREAVANKPWGNEFSEDPFREGDGTGRTVTGNPFIRNIGG